MNLVTRQLGTSSADLQTNCNKVVVKPMRGCVRTGLFPVVVTSCLEQVVITLITVTDLQQVVPTRLIQAVCNKLLRVCCHQLVNNLLRAGDIRLVGTTCCESVGLINLVTR
jgi:hypothetical protein